MPLENKWTQWKKVEWFFFKVLEVLDLKYQVLRGQVQVSTSTFHFFRRQVQVSTQVLIICT